MSSYQRETNSMVLVQTSVPLWLGTNSWRAQWFLTRLFAQMVPEISLATYPSLVAQVNKPRGYDIEARHDQTATGDDSRANPRTITTYTQPQSDHGAHVGLEHQYGDAQFSWQANNHDQWHHWEQFPWINPEENWQHWELPDSNSGQVSHSDLLFQHAQGWSPDGHSEA